MGAQKHQSVNMLEELRSESSSEQGRSRTGSNQETCNHPKKGGRDETEMDDQRLVHEEIKISEEHPPKGVNLQLKNAQIGIREK